MTTDKIEPNKPALLAWVERLESGVDQQGTQALCSRYEDGTEKMCCLGVVTKMNAERLGLEESVGPRLLDDDEKAHNQVHWNGEKAILPSAVKNFLGVQDPNFMVTDLATGYRSPIAALNDRGATFQELAAMIRKEFDL